ncbi:S-layer homology domain-containing protein [Aminipila sp.]|uniref:S-layer homology domain-containing protein n=1 Tax=Aminipila sp. TaxID=2060095 RepID=UPI0028A1D8BB|nr:PQQ-binding-like beta-propeller repeat protein [Aminipila sp.]
MMKKILVSISMIALIVFNIIINTQTAQAETETLFSQGSQYSAGAYDLNAAQPTEYNWTRQSRYTGPSKYEIFWSFSADYLVRTAPAIGADGTIYFSSEIGTMYALNPDKTVKWTYPLVGKPILSSPIIGADGTIYMISFSIFSPVNSNDNKLYAMNPDGTLKWSYSVGGQVADSPAIGADGTIYAGFMDGKFRAINSDINPGSRLKWEIDLGNTLAASPIIGADGTIYIGTCEGKLYAINPAGSIKWSYDVEGFLGNAAAIGVDGTIYIGSDTGILCAINPSGTLKWRMKTSGTEISSSIAIGADGTLYLGAYDYFCAINDSGTTGETKWSLKFSNEEDTRSTPIIGANGIIYTTTQTLGPSFGELYAINPNGTINWKAATGDSRNSPTIGKDGTLYIDSIYKNDGLKGDYRLTAINTCYTITFNSNGGSSVASIKATPGSTIKAPADPVYEGKLFKGWYKDSGCLTPCNFNTDKITADTTIYAKWVDNSPPVLDEIGTVNGEEGSLISFILAGSDPDGSPVTYSAIDLPEGAIFDAASGTLTWTPGINKAGTYTVNFTVSDGELTDSKNATIIVTAKPTYGLAISQTGTYTFPAQTEGYVSTTPKSITISRVGTGDVTNLAVALSGVNEGSFTLEQPSTTILNSSTTSAAFTITPQNGLAAGTYTATITVTADNGINQSFDVTFTVKVNQSSKANLSSLTLSNSTLSPMFVSGITNYTASVPNNITTVTVTPTVEESNATVKVNGITVTSSSSSGAINLDVGSNIVEVTVTAEDGTTKTYTIAIERMEAKPSSGGGDNSPGGGNNSPTNSTTPTYKAVVSNSGLSKSTLPVNVDMDTHRATVDVGTLGKDIFDGTETEGINIPSIPGINAYTLRIPVNSLYRLKEKDSMNFCNSIGNVTIPIDMLAGIAGIKGKQADITIGKGDKSKLTDEIKMTIGDRPLIQLNLTLDGAQTEWNNPAAPVMVSIPYTPTAAELANPERIVVWYIDGSGKALSVPDGHYDPVTRSVTFSTTHFSYYAVGFNQVSFNDIKAGAWYEKAVSYIAAREITKGTGNYHFSPEAKLTRGEFIVMLMKAYGIAPNEKSKDNFKDAGNTYYTGYLAEAKRLGISEGVGNNLFVPKKEITRQEMFTLLYSVLKSLNELPEGDSGKILTNFSDSTEIAAWANDAMTLLVETGTISGNASKLTPKSMTSRAEMAQLLYNLLSK